MLNATGISKAWTEFTPQAENPKLRHRLMVNFISVVTTRQACYNGQNKKTPWAERRKKGSRKDAKAAKGKT
jgi:hypothetical protein